MQVPALPAPPATAAHVDAHFANVWELVFIAHPMFHRQRTTKVLYIEVAMQSTEASIIAQTLEGMFLEHLHPALHTMRGGFHDEQDIPQGFATPSALVILSQLGDVIKTMSTDSRCRLPRVFETALPADVDEDLVQ